jgi:hypothetical protein
MAGEAFEEAGLGRVALLGPGEGPDDDLVQHGTGAEQETAVEGPADDFHKRSSSWDESESSLSPRADKFNIWKRIATSASTFPGGRIRTPWGIAYGEA